MADAALARLAAHMNAAQRDTLRAAMSPVELEAGQVLFRDGEVVDALHVVSGGALELSIEVEGKSVALGRVAPGGFVGELSVLDSATAYATATAREPTNVLRLTRDALSSLRASHADVASLLLRALVEDLAERVRDANTVAADEAPPKRGWFESALAKLFGGG